LPDRRSTRIEDSVHLIVRGIDASRVPYQEKVSTLSISCHGCRYLSRNKVLLGDIVTLEVVHSRAGSSKFATPARVRSVKQLAANEMLFHVSAELECPQDIWGMASPPEDWAEFSRLEASGSPARELQIVPRPATTRSPEPKSIPADPARRFGSLETGSGSPLPPFLAQLAANLRGEIKPMAVATDRAAVIEDTDESLSEFCSQLERKAMKVFEDLVRTFVEELTNRSLQMNDPQKISVLSTDARWPTNSTQK
jgi:hypothetical protein